VDKSRVILNDDAKSTAYLIRVYKPLRRQYEWFKKTQWGSVDYPNRDKTKKGFRWRGRTPDHTLTSGLDDYPRANPPHAGELHVDLLSWVAFYARTLASVAKEIPGMEADVIELEKENKEMVDSLEALHWDAESNVYCDLSVNARGESIPVVHKVWMLINA
jgi:mannosyl-oligosaccharide glucosidase